jgi:hypothetical protein
MKNVSIFIILCTLSINIFCQKPPIKYGKVDIADLKMKYYDKDTSAPAVILCDYGYFSAKTLMFTRTLRIKFFKKEALDLATQQFISISKANISGTTYNLENGEIVKTKLKNESIFEKMIGDFYFMTKISMPNVKEGSIIDVEYSFLGLPTEWNFQQIIPEKWNELIIEETTFISFRKAFFGYKPLKINTGGRWVAEDMPAFKMAPYINSIKNYATRFEFDLLDFRPPTSRYSQYTVYEFTTTWDAVNKLLKESPYFGLVFSNGSGYLKDIANQIKENTTSDEEKVKKAFDAIKIIKWNGEESLYTSEIALSNSYKNKTGNSADINLALVQLLRKLDLDAFPVVMSSRKNGVLMPNSPSLFKLNYVIAAVKINGRTLYLDATEELMPYYLLPARSLNWGGVTMGKSSSEWVEINTDRKEMETATYDLTLQQDLSLTGNITYNRRDYAAYKFRENYQKNNSSDQYKQTLLKDKPGLSVTDFKIDNLDSIYNPIHDSYKVTINNQVLATNDELIINPMLFEQIKKNEFVEKERIYPVHFDYPVEKHYELTLTIPENYKVAELPDPVVIDLIDNTCQFNYQVSEDNGKIKVLCGIKMDKLIFMPDEYDALRNFYDVILQTQS